MQRSVMWVVLAGALWGTTGTAAFFLGSDVSPVAIGAATMGLGGIVLAAIDGASTLALWRDRRDDQALRDRLAEDGYVMLRGALDPSAVRDAAATALASLRRSRPEAFASTDFSFSIKRQKG